MLDFHAALPARRSPAGNPKCWNSSLTFEVQDIPAICAAAHAAGARVLMDNTWGTALNFPALRHGVDLSIHSLTKYVVGHSDALLGVIVARDRDVYRQVRGFHGAMGITVSPDDAFLGLRGLRTLSVRLRQHQEGALAVALEHPQDLIADLDAGLSRLATHAA